MFPGDSRLHFAVYAAVACVSSVPTASALSTDSFGTGANQFTIDFVTISGDASSANGTSIDRFYGVVFTDPGRDYRVSVLEITNEQWDKFEAELGLPVTGFPQAAYDKPPRWTAPNIPVGNISWYEAAQFVNWLNTSTGHQAAYRFVNEQGGASYMFQTWDPAEGADGGSNVYRHKDAFYYLPTDSEWCKAAYWNGTRLQTYATPDNAVPVEDVEANYNRGSGAEPWDVGSGSEELNGTFDMMGNIWEWMEPYSAAAGHGLRGGCYDFSYSMPSYERDVYTPTHELDYIGFRIASDIPADTIPEPLTMAGLLGGVLWLCRYLRLRPRT